MAKCSPNGKVLPLVPLLAKFRATSPCDSHPTAETPLRAATLDDLSDDALHAELMQLIAPVLPVSFHTAAFTREGRFLRHAFAHLLRGQDPLPERLARCVTPGAAYHIAGLGPAFWSAVVRAANPTEMPLWCPALERGLQALGLIAELPYSCSCAERFAAAVEGVRQVRVAAPELSIAQIADFVQRVAFMEGREFPSHATPGHAGWGVEPAEIQRAVREVRSRHPLRQRLRETPPEQLAGIALFQSECVAGRHEAAFAAFRAAFPDSQWEAALPALDDAYSPGLELSQRALLWCEIAAVLCDTFRVHPLELADVAIAAAVAQQQHRPERDPFGGFCSDTFDFLAELKDNNTRDWMTTNRERYQFVLREPLVELCQAVADRYVQPVLNREHGWDMECDARAGRAITSICKNDYGRSGPYQFVQWVTFFRRSQSNRRDDAQFFVRVGSDGVRYGFHLGRSARAAGGQFRKAIQEHGEAVFRALLPGLRLGDCRFWTGEDLQTEVSLRSPAELRAWATHKTIAAGVHRKPDDPVLRGEDLPGEVLLTFDRLLPLFACAAESDPRPLLTRRAGTLDDPLPYDPHSFHRETYLSETWLDRVLGLLRMKKQLVLQGVPGTGKTHVARCLARLLTHDRPGCVRLVQFHPAYCYEEFVEGIRVRNVEANGRSEITYPVEDGVLCEFAAQAAARPSEPHVLIVDELNRGNLPRIFGELLFLLEYRDQAITLPYSKREFRLPENLFVVATMNPLDRSAVAMDQALRRRFSFVDMPADAAVLARWLEERPPETDDTLGPRVVRLFEELNDRLARDLGPEKQVGHSFFMVPALDREKLAAVWDHHVQPLLLDYLGGRNDRLKDFTPERLLGERPARRAKPATDS